jgi:hypothetical protein
LARQTLQGEKFALLDRPGEGRFMRRLSDRREGERTGAGRRARDRILAGHTLPSPVINGRRELANLILFLSDDLRESALAVGAIESFLVRAQRALEKPDLTAEELHALAGDKDVDERFELLEDALSSLRRSMKQIVDSLESKSNH